jgi:hypothetical protein
MGKPLMHLQTVGRLTFARRHHADADAAEVTKNHLFKIRGISASIGGSS